MSYSSVFNADRRGALLALGGAVAGALLARYGSVSAALLTTVPFVLAVVMGILKTGSA